MAAAAIALSLAYFVLKHRPVPGRVTFVLLMIGVAVWSGGYALEISATSFEAKVFWAKVQYFGIAAIPLLWLCFVILYVGESSWLTPSRFVLLAIVPLFTVVLVWFNERLHVIWAGISVDTSLGFSMLRFEYGPALWTYAGYSYLLLLIAALVLFRAIVRLPRLGSRQGAVVLFAALAPWTGNALYLTGTAPFPLLDLTPFSFTVTGLAVAWGMGRFQFMGTVPVAHRAIIEGMQAGVIALDTANNIVELNPAAERMFEVRSAAVVGKPAQHVFAEQPEIIEWLTVSREVTIRGTLWSHGAQRDFDIRTMLLYDRRRHAGRLITFYDISKLARAEREAEEAKELAEAANRAKSEFLAQMSHELRTPLNAIIGFSEIMSRQMLGPLNNPQYLEYTSDINDSATHLLRLITDILDLSKIEAGRLELCEETVDVGQIIESSLTLVEERAADGGIAIEARVARNLPKLRADGCKVKQVVINLLSNAVKFTRSGGKIVISAEVRAAGRLAISVADSGVGIKAQDLDRIMRPFEQVDGALDRNYQGTGLGLPLSKALVELHGGSFELTSEVEVGTTVTAYFPADRVAAGNPVIELHRDT